jgi:amino acid transporter
LKITEIPLAQLPESTNAKPSLVDVLRLIIFGRPIPNEQSEGELLPKLLALPLFCSDAISSVAYGNQQILLALCASGFGLPAYVKLYSQCSLGVSLAIVVLLVIVAASYRQTIFAYPNGGGSYSVSRANLGQTAGLIAAAALMVDYVLTVSVSVTSGLQNLMSVPMFAGMNIANHMVAYSIAIIAFMTFANLRGLREAGTAFAIPTYGFTIMCYLMLFFGFVGPLFGWHFHSEYANQNAPYQAPTGGISSALAIIVLLRAFANGCSSMTGVEALSNGTPAFREPKSKNAAITLVWMALILGTIFGGVAILAVQFHIVYWEQNGTTSAAVIDQLSGTIFGKTGPTSYLYVVTQLFTTMVLVVAAQTSFAGFPRLASILAHDSFLPRQLALLGDKLAFNNGIIILAILSSFFVYICQGVVDKLIPFFAIGVFIAFTMSQTGMVRHWLTGKERGWLPRALVNGLGAVTCSIVVLDIAAEKFFEGAWAIIVIMIALVTFFKYLSNHYHEVWTELRPEVYRAEEPAAPLQNTVIVLINGVHAGTLNALEYARSISDNCTALSVETDPARTPKLKQDWQKYAADIPLVILQSPYRSLVQPITRYLDTVHQATPNHRITVVIGEFVPSKWWFTFFHGNTGLLLKLWLLNRPDIVVANVRFWVDESPKGVYKAEQEVKTLGLPKESDDAQ